MYPVKVQVLPAVPKFFVDVAQLARVRACQVRGCGFESHHPHQLFENGRLAEWITGTRPQPWLDRFDSCSALQNCRSGGTGIHSGLKPRVLRVRISPSAPKLMRERGVSGNTSASRSEFQGSNPCALAKVIAGGQATGEAS